MTIRYTPRQEREQSTESGWPSPPDPGDLSKRIALRRTELRLSRAQVAARARMTPRYLECLERYPATPDAGMLRQLAAALRTTPAALLGGGGQVPPGHPRPADHAATVKLTPGECRRLIAPGGIGRIGFTTASGPVVLPVNFAMVAGTIVVRTGAGTMIGAHAGDSQVAFEIDHIDEALSQGWSVLVRGQAHRALQPAELRHLQENAGVCPWPGGNREVYLRVVPSQITGRRIEIR